MAPENNGMESWTQVKLETFLSNCERNFDMTKPGMVTAYNTACQVWNEKFGRFYGGLPLPEEYDES